MQLCNIEPFVRKVTTARLSETTHYDVYNELRASDCRLFYSVNGSGSIVTEGHVWDMKPRCAVLVSAGSRYVWQPAAGEPMQFISVNFDYTQNFCHIRKFTVEYADVGLILQGTGTALGTHHKGCMLVQSGKDHMIGRHAGLFLDQRADLLTEHIAHTKRIHRDQVRLALHMLVDLLFQRFFVARNRTGLQ